MYNKPYTAATEVSAPVQLSWSVDFSPRHGQAEAAAIKDWQEARVMN
ncbi:hypothetical protein ACFODZ_00800 [Marinicella sediminis]|uniref:Uncharacterized protein n=1 Tax=Marinicella sediminis TaxID=1792834 RepID=A0ABV7J3X1_9GAMM|nr:hypothetical protein [Marinicella sediminis]